MDGRRMLRALVVGIAAAVLGGVVGAVLTRGLMRLVALVAGGDPAFSWTGLAFIAVFYIVFLAPGAVALAWGRSRWSQAVLALGAVAIPVQAAGIAQSDLEGVGPLGAGQWTALTALFVAMAVVYALQAVLVYRLARSGAADRGREPAARLTAA
ncbi:MULTISPECIES: hypothetical protein [unclassified Blastococcus]